VWVTAVALQILLNDKYNLESLQGDGSRTRQEIPQTAGCKARACNCWTNPGGGLCNMDQCYKWQYLYKVLAKCLIGYQFFVQTINQQGNYKTGLAEVSGPIRTI